MFKYIFYYTSRKYTHCRLETDEFWQSAVSLKLTCMFINIRVKLKRILTNRKIMNGKYEKINKTVT